MSKREKDKYLIKLLNDSIKIIEELLWLGGSGNQVTYYSGNFQKDVEDNFKSKEKKLFYQKIQKYTDSERLVFLQKKIPNTEYYDYIAVKR
jgi:hypothetical protein